ncbi:MAG: efflux RND transporter periplasmic adaptor subunit [Oscillospiraceae bacterium]|nr:efflux RND transporter periplasmic adaptor subunit [Oscillospiraceae bacterium]
MKAVSLLVFLIFISMFTGCILPVEEELLPPDLLKPEEVRFRTIEVERGTIQDILEDNVVVASSVYYELTFDNRSGYLAELNVVSGSAVKEGDVLARLDTGIMELDITRQRIAVEKQRLNLEETRRSGGSRYARRHAELDLELAELALLQMESDLEKATIISPIDGEIVFLNDYKIGSFVPGRSIVMTIADPAKLHFEYTGSHIARIRLGMDVDITIGAQTIPATVTMTPSSVPEEDRDRFRNTVVISVNNEEDLPDNLRRGSRHRFSIFMQEKQDAIIIPVGSMSSFMGQHFAQILEDGIRTERDLNTGITTDTHVEILNGLEEGDLLIIGVER